jgi:hypothetical protein
MVLKTNGAPSRVWDGVVPALKNSTREKNRSARGSEECERATHRALTAGQRRGGPCWTSWRAGTVAGERRGTRGPTSMARGSERVQPPYSDGTYGAAVHTLKPTCHQATGGEATVDRTRPLMRWGEWEQGK